MEDREFSIETPIGTVKSDSGNHVVDVISVLLTILVVFLIKKVSKHYG
tara:strand:- start:199 stop:342 length:144 start_codon:yes stop_codon:yes gene_type:complete